MESLDNWPINLSLQLSLLFFFAQSLPGLGKELHEKRAVFIVTQLSLLDHGAVLSVKDVGLFVFLIKSLLVPLPLLLFSFSESSICLINLTVIVTMRLVEAFSTWRLKVTVLGLTFTFLVFIFLILV